MIFIGVLTGYGNARSIWMKNLPSLGNSWFISSLVTTQIYSLMPMPLTLIGNQVAQLFLIYCCCRSLYFYIFCYNTHSIFFSEGINSSLTTTFFNKLTSWQDQNAEQLTRSQLERQKNVPNLLPCPWNNQAMIILLFVL